MMSIFGAGAGDRFGRARRSSSRIGSIRCEWKACEVASVLDLNPLRVEAGQHLAHGRLVARDDDAFRPIERGDRHPRRRTLRARRPLAASAANTAAIRPPGRQRLHEPRPLGDQPQAVFQREHAGHAGRGELADAVAHHRRRLDAPTAPQRGQRVLDGEHHRLRVARLVQQRTGLRIQQRQQRAIELRPQQSRHMRRSRRGTSAASRTARGPCRRTGRPGR